MKRYLVTLLMVVCFAFSGQADAKKYKAVHESPDKIPEEGLEQRIWKVGKAHQKKVRENGEALDVPEVEKYIESIATRLLADKVDIIGMEVDVVIFRSSIVNAWVYPDGTIGVQSGLISAMENEAQLAAILGHEISHFLNRHAYIQIKSKEKQSAIGKGLGILATIGAAAKTGRVDTSLMEVGEVWTGLLTSGYSRKLETQADAEGLELLVAAGYAPNESLPAFEQLRQPEDDRVSLDNMWSSHPDIDSRLKNLKKRIKKIDSPPDYVPAANDYYRAVGPVLLVNAGLDVRQRKFDSARKSINQYIQGNPDSPTGHFNLGEVWRTEQPQGPDYSLRMNAYQQAIAVDPDYAKAHRELGMAWRQQGNNEQAAVAFSRYLELAPDAPDSGIIRWYLESLQNPELQKTAVNEQGGAS